MEKRLSRSDYLLALLFIFMLICAVGTFFFGVKIGQDKMKTKYETFIKQNVDVKSERTAYHQKYLVSFYHTIYVPYKEFQKKWFDSMSVIEQPSVNRASVLQQLAKLADEKYNSIQSMTMPDTSPLLQNAHQNYLKSLKLFSDSFSSFQTKANKTATLLDDIRNDAYFQEATKFALKAQNDYFSSIVKWNESEHPDLAGVDLLANPKLSAKQWTSLNINLKNSYMASLMTTNNLFLPAGPQDLTARVDELIHSGQANKMNLSDIQQMVDTLVGTGAVRPGDFIQIKNKWYQNETLPQLPLFYEKT